MPRRSLLTAADRAGLLAFPTADDELIRYYTFSEPDLSAIRERRGNHNRLGFAVQLCYLRYPGFVLPLTRSRLHHCWQPLGGSCVSIQTSGLNMPSGGRPGANTWRNCRRG